MVTTSPSMEAQDRAEESDKHSAALIAAGSVTATFGGAFITVTALEPGRPIKPIWANAWFDIGFACAIIGLALAAFGLYLNFRRHARIPPAASGRPGSALPPLVVTVMADSRFVGWRHTAMIAALHVEIENSTDKDIVIDGYEFTCDNEGQPLEVDTPRGRVAGYSLPRGRRRRKVRGQPARGPRRDLGRRAKTCT